VSVRLATSEDMTKLGATLPPWAVRWGGWVYPADGEPTAYGLVYWDASGRAFCFFDGEAPAIVMHRVATRALCWLRMANASRILSACDQSRPRAAEWLRRLGFRPTETEVPGFETQVWELCDHST
jgi:hypothetical protein